MDKDKVNDAIEIRNNWLQENPHMKKYQKEIAIMLDKAGSNPATRLEVLCLMMTGKLVELQSNLNTLSSHLGVKNEEI